MKKRIIAGISLLALGTGYNLFVNNEDSYSFAPLEELVQEETEKAVSPVFSEHTATGNAVLEEMSRTELTHNRERVWVYKKIIELENGDKTRLITVNNYLKEKKLEPIPENYQIRDDYVKEFRKLADEAQRNYMVAFTKLTNAIKPIGDELKANLERKIREGQLQGLPLKSKDNPAAIRGHEAIKELTIEGKTYVLRINGKEYPWIDHLWSEKDKALEDSIKLIDQKIRPLFEEPSNK